MIRWSLLLALVALSAPATADAAFVVWSPPPPEPPGTPPEQSCSRYAQCPPAILRVVDSGSERNDLTLEARGSEIVVRDAAAPLEASGGCRSEPDGSVRCPAAPVVRVDAGGGDDAVNAPMASIVGEAGNDVLVGTDVSGGAGADTLTGTESSDRLDGGPEVDVVDARGGNDTVSDAEGGTLAGDRLHGGPGVDVLSFASRAGGVRVDLGAAQQGGALGEGNVVAGFESAIGGSGPDELVGPVVPAPQLLLAGNEGDDRLVLRAGGYSILGGARGGPGADRIVGGPAGDYIDGGSGPDVLGGGDGEDALYGRSGRDRIFARDGELDGVACGGGRDRAIVDRRERAPGCERVSRPRRRR